MTPYHRMNAEIVFSTCVSFREYALRETAQFSEVLRQILLSR
jgi:hypothetical protein